MKKLLSALICLTMVALSVIPAFADECTDVTKTYQVPVSIDVEGLQFSATIPSEIPIYVNNKNVVTTPSNLAVTNNSAGPISIKSAILDTTDSNWTIGSTANKKVNSKTLEFKFGPADNLHEYASNGNFSTTNEPFINSISSGEKVDLQCDVKIVPQSTPVTEGIGKMNFVFDWVRE